MVEQELPADHDSSKKYTDAWDPKEAQKQEPVKMLPNDVKGGWFLSF